jgi:hypothetical protein
MNIEAKLNTIADGYRAHGFRVVVRPGPADLPPFAMDFKVEILAAGPTATSWLRSRPPRRNWKPTRTS